MRLVGVLHRMVSGIYDTLLVPYDGSDGANRAVEHAFDLAEHYGATVHALFVVDTHRYGEPALSTTELVVNEITAEGTDMLQRLAERADNEDIEMATECCHGHPYAEILDYADEIDADLVVMGYEGQSHQEHIGSTVERVVRSGRRPVLIA
jgi:nucleotide-binding universal stress UspA family protein